MYKIKMNYFIASIASLFIGFCFYLLFRNINNLLFLKWINVKFINNMYIQLTPSIILNILKYNFPDMLWFLSGILFVRYIWFDKYNEQKIYLFVFYGIGFIFETSQLKNDVHGTFDLLDLFFMGFGAFIEGMLYSIFIKRRILWKRNG